MKEFFKKFWINNPKVRKIAGVTLIVIGLLSVITPFTPVGFLFLIGLEILGLRTLFWEKVKSRFKNKKTSKID
ncbi:MAG: hypothetical protein A3G05_01760 [Candidatus Zambryskibacteria bacterium RIFCSPLOWO2_12_FULL_45_14]|uniref:Uncharacterized protein n=2 Tax=Candidatus Zambryskiibacteriota TaxID=1817925 RepID=A0A1G2UM16_9BACT|nr:MAG: hypothetical protein A3H60_00345 [Candidatus Zambryskibacteria bacterium RIFCSPLOWO2_02_FULL_44_12b]OHB14078.1 MAG: hypothetical protein A3G05_01760 [Candidatus Zambryskibacteria bacterium RIFCSPLOWO2_12_FULL_45_14]